MSDRELKARITGQVDGSVKAAFAEVSTGAARMGTAVDTAGKRSSASLKELSRSSDDVRVRMVAVGAAIGTMAGFLSDASRSSEESARIQRQLEQAIQNTGASYDQYADKIKAAGERAVQLGIDDEAAMQAIQALTESTGSAQVALDNLGLAEDIAAAKGISVQTAAELLGKVLNGNVGILARYGISVEKGASSTEALAQIQTQVAGQAEAHASSLARWKVQLDNVAESIGGALGSAAPFVAMLPGIAQGASLAGAAIGAFSGLLRTQQAATVAATVAQEALAVATAETAVAGSAATVAGTGLLGVLGPIGLVAAAAAAAYGIYKLTQSTGTDYVTAAEAANKVTEELNVTLGRLAGTGSPLAAIGTAWTESLRAGIAGIQQQMAEVDAQRTALAGDALGPDGLPVAMNPNDPALLALEAQMEALTQASSDAGYALIAIGNIMTDTGSGAEMAQQAAAKLFDEYSRTGDVAVYIAGLMEINDGLGDFDIKANAAALRTGFLAEAMSKAAEATKLSAAEQKTLDDVTQILNEGTQEQIDLVTRLYGQLEAGTISSNDFAVATDRQSDILSQNEAKLKAATAAGEAYSKSLIAGMTAQADAAHERNAALAEGNRQINNAQYGKPPGAFDYEAENVEVAAYYKTIAEGERKANEARADRVVELPELASKINSQVVVDLTDEFWAMQHAGETAMDKIARGSTSAAVALAAFKEAQDGVISAQGPYSQQLSEYGQQLNYITAAEDLLNQRKADGIAISAEQQDFLDRADAAQERLTGGTEDATIALGEQALQYAENMRIGDQMNEKLGQNADSSDALRGSIDALTIALGGIPPDTTANVHLNDEVTPNLGGILSALKSLDGYTVNTFIKTTYTTPMDINQTYLGGVQSFANGGLVSLAEAGSELVSFRNGGSALAMNRGIYALSDGDYVHTAPATKAKMSGMGGGFTFNNYGDIHGFSGVEEVVASFEAALNAHLIGIGM